MSQTETEGTDGEDDSEDHQTDPGWLQRYLDQAEEGPQ